MTGIGSITATHAYSAEGIFDISVEVADDDTGTSSSRSALALVGPFTNTTPVVDDQSFTVAENSAIGTVIVVWAVHAGQVLATLVSTASVCVQVDPLTILQNAEDLGGIADTREEQLFETEKAVGSGANS